VRGVSGEHRAHAHAEAAIRDQHLLPHGDPAALAIATNVERRHQLRAIGDEAEHVLLRDPAHTPPLEVATIEMLVDIERYVAVLDRSVEGTASARSPLAAVGSSARLGGTHTSTGGADGPPK
jgi:hypothetical protein